MHNLILYGTSGCGKSTLAELLTAYHYKWVPTGEMTRYLSRVGCMNMPTMVMNIINNLDPTYNYVFDHFYMHTYKQLLTLGDVTVLAINDLRVTAGVFDEVRLKKRARFAVQKPIIDQFLTDTGADVVTVNNLDIGFDVAELIHKGLLPFEAFAVLGVPEVIK